MTRTVNIHQAKTHLSRLLDEVEGGEEVIIARNGHPVARLVSVSGPTERPMGFVKGSVTDAFFDVLPESELSVWTED